MVRARVNRDSAKNFQTFDIKTRYVVRACRWSPDFHLLCNSVPKTSMSVCIRRHHQESKIETSTSIREQIQNYNFISDTIFQQTWRFLSSLQTDIFREVKYKDYRLQLMFSLVTISFAITGKINK